MRRISKDITKHYQMACSSGELHAIFFLKAHVFYVLIQPFLRLFCYMCIARQKRRQSPTKNHKVRTVLQTYSLHHVLHTHFFFTD